MCVCKQRAFNQGTYLICSCLGNQTHDLAIASMLYYSRSSEHFLGFAIFMISSSFHLPWSVRSLMQRTCSCIRPFTPSSIVWAASLTRPRTCGSGPSAWLTLVSALVCFTAAVVTEEEHLVMLCVCFRVIWGAVVNGDADLLPAAQLCGFCHHGVYICCLRCANRIDPARHGRPVRFPPRTSTSLVRETCVQHPLSLKLGCNITPCLCILSYILKLCRPI